MQLKKCLATLLWCGAWLGAAGAFAGDYPDQLLWGDTHLHTSRSTDAYIFGNQLVGPEEAYRFARGERVTSNSGLSVQLTRPLDFLVVADHAEYFGRGPDFSNAIKRTLGREPAMRDLIGFYSKSLYSANLLDDVGTVNQSAWQDTCALADQFNEPGEFSAFIGFEWSSMPGGANLHRVVVFADGADKACQVLPFSTFDSARPEALWDYLQAYEQKTGGRVLAIPHNANLSGGQMFSRVDSDGLGFDEAYARRRLRWEPLYEVVQIKGDSETHRLLSPGDPFAPDDLFNVTEHLSNQQLAGSFARSALQRGLAEEARLGSNPFQFGMIGSSDSHTGLSTVEEEEFNGKFSFAEPSPEASRWDREWPMDEPTTKEWQMDAAGYAAVWARDNTREAIFEAMQRREVYATTGSRIVLRFFGGWGFPESILENPDFIREAYRVAVPMGGVMSPRPDGVDGPVFMVIAARDPMGNKLARLQIVKGWHDPKTNERHEKIFNVSVADSLEGAAQMSALWRDPTYHPGQAAFYYARVIETPSQRWSTLDAARFNEALPESLPKTIVEKAYSSPIWYKAQRH